ncbi:MAG: site-specific DNA-methyltransferase [Candidatus Marinimicrobia bacterium]|nr:site-specific DNA-methyltransferase [Candidatus Neomarinimicrobiota bacterium]
MSFNETLQTLLKSDPRFVDQDGDLLKSEVIDKAWKIDRQLIGLLLDNAQIKAKFFDEIKGHWVFNINTFIDYVQDKNFYASSYTKFRNKIGLTIDGKYLKERGEVALVWPYKDCVLEGGQSKEEEKRKEIFFNEVLAQDEIDRLLDPKVLSNFKRYTVKGEEPVNEIKRDKDGTIRENLIIKGNNLLALHSLKKQFQGKVKLIYIDPPFNTGGDSFNYNDSFMHSTWLTFMKNRLLIAKEMLTNDGNIFIHIDINESHYLKVLCDEVYDRENFVEEIIWAYGSPSGGRAAGAKPVNIHDYILHYAKQYQLRKQNKIFTPYSKKYIADWFKYKDNDGRLYQKRMRGRDQEGNVQWEKQYLDESKGLPLTTVWTDIKQVYADPRAYKENQSEHAELIKGFPTQKPERLIQRIIEMASEVGDIIMDFQLGSGTTASVAHKIGRQYIGVEQLDYGKDDSVIRLQKVIKGDKTGISKEIKWTGGGDFIYCELMKYNEAFIERIRDAEDTDTILSIWEEMKARSFLNYNVDIKKMDENIAEFRELSLSKQKDVLLDILNKNQLYVNLSEIEDNDFKVSEEDKRLNRLFYGE